MDASTLLQIISTVGFPIAMCIALCWYIRELNTSRQKESEKFTEALNNNTLVLQKLCDSLGVEREG